MSGIRGGIGSVRGASGLTTGNPVRNPDLSSSHTMTKRAWWLVILNILIPGSAQLLAGSRKVGRLAVRLTFTLWIVAIAAGLVYYFAPRFLYGLATNEIALTVIQGVLIIYAVLWMALTLDTLRLVRLVRAGPRARPLIAAFAVLALAVSAGGAGYAAMVAGVSRDTLGALFASGDYQDPVDGQYNILLLGGDAGPDRTGLRPDSISVASINADTGATTIIGIPRNFENVIFSDGSPLWNPFPSGYDCGDECLINYLYTYGQEHPDLYPDAVAAGSQPGIEATRDAVSGVTGLVLQYYVVIDMQGFSQLVDSLGGVTIDVPTRVAIGGITGAKPMYYVEPGVQHFDGEGALWYARSRYDGNDYDRMQRQRQVQAAILSQAQPANVLTKFQDVAEAGVQVVSTDIPSAMLPSLVDLATRARERPLGSLELVPGVIDNVDHDYDEIHALVQSALHPDAAK